MRQRASPGSSSVRQHSRKHQSSVLLLSAAVLKVLRSSKLHTPPLKKATLKRDLGWRRVWLHPWISISWYFCHLSLVQDPHQHPDPSDLITLAHAGNFSQNDLQPHLLSLQVTWLRLHGLQNSRLEMGRASLHQPNDAGSFSEPCWCWRLPIMSSS